MPNDTINIGTEINLKDLLQSRALIQANSGGGKSVLARVIIEESFGIVPFIVLDIEGEYYTLKEKFGDVLIIGGQHADIPISLQSVKLLPKEIIANRLSVVIDTSDLQMGERILYSKYFLETMMDLPKEYWVNYLVFIEEAHKLCGEQDKQASATAVKDLMSRGRKRGYSGILITQRISKLHKDAAAECNNKFIGRTFLDIDLDRAAKELGLSSQADKNVIRNLKPGRFYAFGTSIKPHQVHEVTIKLPKTKIPKAGVDLNIKPQAPTEKIKAMLAKLNDLPAVKETKTAISSLSKTEANQLEKLKQQNDVLNKEHDHLSSTIDNLEQRLMQYEQLKFHYAKQEIAIRQIIDKAPPVKIDEALPNEKQVPVSKSFTDHNRSFTSKVYQKVNSNGSKLSKCATAILQFLASFSNKTFTKVQVGVMTGYSSNSGGFNNSISELATKGLITRTDGRMSVNNEANISEYLGEFTQQEYSINTFKDKLGKCEKEIYEVLLAHPNDQFSKIDLAAKTETKYSYNSGGFNNSISALNTLELIKRTNGLIYLNPELLNI